MSFLLGVVITCDCTARTLHLLQYKYAQDLLQRFEFADCSPVSTLLDPGTCLNLSQCLQTPEDEAFICDKLYISAVRALMYLAIATRPDIAYAIGVLCRFMACPSQAQ